MNILMAIGSPDFTGASRMALVIARALKDAGHHIFVVSDKRPPSNESSVLDALRAIGIECFEEKGFDRRLPDRNLIKQISLLAKQHGVQCLISEQQQDLKVMPIVAKKTGIPLIYHAQNRVQFGGNVLFQLLKRNVYRRMLTRHVAKTICVSDVLRTQHIQEYGIPPHKVVTVDNGVEIKRFEPIDPEERAKLRRDLGVEPDELMLINVGRLTLQKGQDVLLRSLIGANLDGRKYKLVIVGTLTLGIAEDEAYAKELHRLASDSELKSRVIFAGWRDNVPALLRSADILTHSANWEGMPLAVLEAMAAGLPSVSTDCAGILPGFIDGVHGYVVPTGDVVGFRRGIEQIVRLSSEQRAQMAQAAEELVRKNFDVSVTTSKFVSLVEQVVSGHSTEPVPQLSRA